VKYRLEYSAATAARAGGPGWEFYGDFPSRAAAHEAARAVRRQFGPSTRTRIVPVADDAPEPKRGPR
jgi:hypothetical protein